MTPSTEQRGSEFESLEDVLHPEAKESLEHLELVARRTVEGMLHGIHPSDRIGVSTDFDHHKEYQPGDPLKHMDWKASARSDRYYIKRYIEDTSLTVRLVLDHSASMLRASGNSPTKYVHASRIAACLAYLVLREQDSAGLALTTAEGTHWVPPSSKGDQLVAILTELLENRPAGEDSVAECLRGLKEQDLKRGMIILLSDLMYDPEPVEAQLASMMAQGQEVLVFQVRDPVEEDFPFNRWVQFENLEDPSTSHRVDAIPLKKIYREEYQKLLEDWDSWAKRHGAHLVTLRTDEKMEPVISEYLKYREQMA